MSYRCPACGASSRSRHCEFDECSVRTEYFQCNNLYCGVCFRTLTVVDVIISDPPEVTEAGSLAAETL